MSTNVPLGRMWMPVMGTLVRMQRLLNAARPVRWYALAALLALGACAHPADPLLGTWSNPQPPVKRPAIYSMQFLPQQTVTVREQDALGAAGWHPPQTWTGSYAIIAPGMLKITTQLASVVLRYAVADQRLTVSGEGLSQMLGKGAAPQQLVKAAP